MIEPRFSIFGIDPHSKVFELPSHSEAVGHRLLLGVHVEEVIVERGRLVHVHARTKVEQEAGVVAEKPGTERPVEISDQYVGKNQC